MEGAMAFIALAVLFQVDAAGLHKLCNINVALNGVDFFLFYHLSSSFLVSRTAYLVIDSMSL